MNFSDRFRHIRRGFFKPHVVVYILTGVSIMFLTFLTSDNSLELGISGIASIFIGIGVNNLTAMETEQKDKKRLNHKTHQAIRTLQHIQVKIKMIKELAPTHPQLINAELAEMDDYIDLSTQYLKEE